MRASLTAKAGILALGLLTTASAVHADPPASGSPANHPAGATARAGPPRARALSAYLELTQRGISLALKGEYPAALDALDGAVRLDPANPEAFYYIAEVQRMQGRFAAALVSFATVARLAKASRNDALQARALLGQAITLERMDERWVDALRAWNAYARFASEADAVAHLDVARERARVLTGALQRRQAARQVRQRLLERAAQKVHSKAPEAQE